MLCGIIRLYINKLERWTGSPAFTPEEGDDYGQHDAYDNRERDGQVEGEILTADDDVAGKAPKQLKPF